MTNSPLPSRIGVTKQVYLEFCQMSFLERFPDEVKYNVDNLNKGAYVGVPGSPQLLLKGRGGTLLKTSYCRRGEPQPPTTHLTRCEADLHRETPNV